MRQKHKIELRSAGAGAFALIALISVLYLSAFAPSPCKAASSKIASAAQSTNMRSLNVRAQIVRKFQFNHRRQKHTLNEDEASAVMSLGTRHKLPVGSGSETIERFALPERDAQWDLRRTSTNTGSFGEYAPWALHQRAYFAQAPPSTIESRPAV